VLIRLLGVRVVYDSHEDLPMLIYNRDWIPRPLKGVLSFLIRVIEQLCTLAFSDVVAATPKIAEHFPTSKVLIIQNFPIASELVVPGNCDYNSRPNLAVYAGSITAIRGAAEMVDTMTNIDSSLAARLELAGPFAPASLEKSLKSSDGWACVKYNGQLSRNEMAQMLSRARIGLVLFHPKPNHVDAQPNKMFEYMSAGIPIVTSNFPLWKQIVEGTRCGLVVNPLDSVAIARAIEWLLRNPEEAERMGQRGKTAVEEQYNWEPEAKKLVGLYERLLSY
jgi:glycosyltransferase involved in cell wall biosynthesis